jgi:hypothetical protein
VNAPDVPTPKDGVLFRELENGCVLYDAETEKVHSLNLTAGVIWCLIDGARPLGDIADEVTERSDAGRGDPSAGAASGRRSSRPRRGSACRRRWRARTWRCGVGG